MQIKRSQAEEADPGQRRAFTLIELIVVIVIIGILAAVALVAFNTVIFNARMSAAANTATQVAKLVAAQSAADQTPPGAYTAVRAGAGGDEIAFSTLTFEGDLPADVDRFRVTGAGSLSVVVNGALCSGTTFDTTQPGVVLSFEVTCLEAEAATQATGLTATASNSQVTLDWEEPEVPVEDYFISYSPDAGTTWTLFPDGVSSATSVAVTGLTNGTTYSFQVAASNLVATALPAEAVATPFTTPDAPTAVSAEAGNTSAEISFTPPAFNGGRAVTSYTVTSAPEALTCTTAATSCVVSGLTPSASYTFTVVATNEAGDGQTSAPSGAVEPYTVPDAPTALTGTVQNGTVDLSWTAPADDGNQAITDYAVEYKLSSGNTWTLFARGASTATTATVTGLAAGVAYDFRVAAINAAGAGTRSGDGDGISPLATGLIPNLLPGVPTTVLGTPGNAEVPVAWTAPAPNGGTAITSYTVTSNPGALTCTTAGLGCTVSGLTNDTAYTFTVRATNAMGEGAASTPSAPVTPASPYNAATGGTVTTVANYNGTGQTWRVHTFTSNGTFTVDRSLDTWRTLVVGGGGGGLASCTPKSGSGGNAGAITTDDTDTILENTYAVTVGSGGEGMSVNTLTGPWSGTASSIATIATAAGGGGAGAGWCNDPDGVPGSGAALVSTITGAPVTYAAGGSVGGSPAPNTGSGGSGGSAGGNHGTYGSSGVVIIAYQIG